MKPAAALSSLADEEAVLGILLENIPTPDGLTLDHFQEPGPRIVIIAIKALDKDGQPHDFWPVRDKLTARGELERIGGPQYLDKLREDAPPPERLAYHVERLDLARSRRTLDRAGQKMQELAADPAADKPDQLEARCAAIVADLADQGNPLDVLDAAAWLHQDLPEPVQVLRGAFDLNTKTCIAGPSKARKSFFLLQAAVSLSAGLPDFLAWQIDAPRTVLCVNMEIPEAHFHRRLRRMVKALNITPDQLKGRLHIMNARGMPADPVLARIVTEARRVKAEVVIIDPIYKLIPGDESKQENVKALLTTMDRVCNSTGAALVYVHHGTKGEAGDRLTIDRAAGSGVLARDVDCLVSLANHITDGLLVVEQIARSYAPKNAFSIRWDTEADCFQVEADTPPTVRTSYNKKRTGTGPGITEAQALALVEAKPLTSGEFDDALEALGLSREPARRMKARLVDAGRVITFKTKAFQSRTYYGTPEGIEQMKTDNEKP